LIIACNKPDVWVTNPQNYYNIIIKRMKTISFAIINIITLSSSLISLEFLTGEYHVVILVSSLVLFVVSGAFSVFKKEIGHFLKRETI